jgi:hypothetical protein
MTKVLLPPELGGIRERARRAIAPLKAADSNTRAEKNFLFAAKRTKAGRELPPYYLVYFLLVDLLESTNLGQFEKVAWSVPVDLDGVAYLIEHRKLGMGVFSREGEEERQASRIVRLIDSGVKAARPFFKWVADNAVKNSRLNVTNNCGRLFGRYSYFLESFRAAADEAEKRGDECHVETRKGEFGEITTYEFPAHKIARNASWLALAAIDAFYSWTEHVFIHLAILQGEVTTGEQVAMLAESEWGLKFKAALDITDPATKKHFDGLVTIRHQRRNLMAHGAFGKQGEALSFHSGAGAVPVIFERRHGTPRFSLSRGLAFDDAEALATIEKFIIHLWSGSRRPAKIYLQDSDLPLILPMASDGTYRNAMASVEEMNTFAEYLSRRFDDSANMDW